MAGWPVWVRAIIAGRALVVGACVLLAVPALHFARQIESEESFEEWFSPDDRSWRTFQDFQDTFGSDMFAVAVLTDVDVFDAATLRTLRVLGQRLAALPGVVRVTSLADVEHVRGVEDGLVVEPLVPEDPLDREALATLRERALGTDLYRRWLVSDDARTAAVVADLVELDDASTQVGVVADLRRVVEQTAAEAGLPILLGGFAVLDAEIHLASRADGRLFVTVAIPTMFLVLFAVLRRFRPVLLAFATVALALVFTFGLYVARGHTFGILTSILPILIMSIGLAQAVHVLVHYYEELASGRAHRNALAATLRAMVRPCFFTSLTTALALASFLVSDVPALRVTGVYGACGVVLTFLLALGFLPALLAFVPPPSREAQRHYGRGGMTTVLTRVTAVAVRTPRGVLAGAGILVLFCGGAALRVSSETVWAHLLRPGDPVRQANERIEQALSGMTSLEVVTSGPPGHLTEPATLADLERLTRFLLGQPKVTKVVSIVDYLQEIGQALAGGDRGAYRLPPSKEAAAQSLLLYEVAGGEELEEVATLDYAQGRLIALLGTMSTREATALRTRVEEFARAELGIEVVATGTAVLLGEMESKIRRSQVRSLGLAALLILVCMTVLLRSLTLGLVSMLPNLIPIVAMFGLMGAAGIPLDVTTVIVASLALGIAVDDTIHYMARFRRELAETGRYEAAIRRAHRSIGRAIVLTSVILGVGFSTLTLASFEGTFYFGVLCAFSMAVALLGDLLLLPALLLVLRPLLVPRAGAAEARPAA